jgi:mannitol/fructose-specific phosphotransferase system IIA component (Ntr-type)
MRLSEHLREEMVIHGLEAKERTDVLRSVSEFLAERGLVRSEDEVFRLLEDREESHTTALGDGVALPHAVIPDLKERLFLVIATAAPLPYGPDGQELVDVLFVLLSPPGMEGEHIKLLARICRLVRQPGFLDEIRSASDPKDLFEVVLAEDARHV